MDVADFDFELPSQLIAQRPAPERGGSRLLVLHRGSGEVEHSAVARLPDLLHAGDRLVVNDTKVFPARLIGAREPSGGAVECLLLSRLDAGRWEALVHPGQKLKPGARMRFTRASHVIHGEILERHFHGRRTIRIWTDGGEPLEDAIDAIGHIPLPPYIRREDDATDRERYQTVYARERGSVAAPTAGLHFTPPLLEALADKGVGRAAITLHVGYGTFQPVRTSRVDAHAVAAEQFSIGAGAAAAINETRRGGGRVVAVGTTTVRALETAARGGDAELRAQAGWTELFIHPGFEFRVVSGLMTNFHLPKSSLLMLVCAFGGRDRVLAAYRDAVARGYRFYSYGDAMLIV